MGALATLWFLGGTVLRKSRLLYHFRVNACESFIREESKAKESIAKHSSTEVFIILKFKATRKYAKSY